MKVFSSTYNPILFLNTISGYKVFVCTQATPGFLDLDGNEYDTVTIGTQEWVVQNLKVTKFADGTDIPLITDGTEWINDSDGAMCYYNNDTANKAIYGGLYNWYAVDNGLAHFERYGIKEEGWRAATADDYTTLSVYLSSAVGGKLKEAGTTHWQSPNTGATDEVGFTGLPAGYRNAGDGSFGNLGQTGLWWLNSEYDSWNAYYRLLNYNTITFPQLDADKHYGFSIRCVRDLTTPPSSVTADNIDITSDNTDITADQL